MIVLEFRLTETFRRAASLLEQVNIPFGAEVSQVEYRPHWVWLFQDDVHSPNQQEALAKARSLEREDRVCTAARTRSAPNLADPS